MKAHKTDKTCINQSRHTRLTKLASVNQGTQDWQNLHQSVKAHKTDKTCISQSRHTNWQNLHQSVKAHKTDKTCIKIQSRHTRLIKLASINEGTQDWQNLHQDSVKAPLPIQERSCHSSDSLLLTSRLVEDYCLLFPDPSNVFHRLPSISPLFVCNFTTAVTALFTFSCE